MTLLEAAAASKDLVSIVKDALLAGAGCATVAIAYFGLSTWNRQLRGGADFEVARKLAKALYALREALAAARSRLLHIHELDPVPGVSDAGPGTRYGRAYDERWKGVSEALQDFDAAVLEAEALWGADVRSAAERMHQCVRTLAASMAAIVANERSRGEDFRADPDFAKEMRRNVHASRDDADPLSLEISSAITTMEANLRPHLRRG